FFFASRRRHTSSNRDWSSDVCSSDLSSVYFRNPQGRIIAALCINFDVSTIAQAKGLLEGLLPDNEPEPAQAPNKFIGRDLVAVKIGRASCRERWRMSGAA